MAIRGKLLLASGAIVLLSEIVGFVALTINSAIRIDIGDGKSPANDGNGACRQ